MIAHPEEGNKGAAKVIGAANRSRADALILSCPLCEYNLGRRQESFVREDGSSLSLPVFYFSHLLALALDALFRRRPAVAAVVTATVLLVCTGLTWARNEVWTTRIRMWEDVTTKSPAKARGHHNLGLAWWERLVYRSTKPE